MRTITNYKNKHKDFRKNGTEHLLKRQKLFEPGKEVFGSSEEFARWLDKSFYGLEDCVPEKHSTTIPIIVSKLYLYRNM